LIPLIVGDGPSHNSKLSSSSWEGPSTISLELEREYEPRNPCCSRLTYDTEPINE
jgi:hypothetical protein